MDDIEWNKIYDNFKLRIKNNPNDGDLWLKYAMFLDNECDNPKLTLKAVQKASELLPEQDLRIFLGNAYIKNGEFESGISIISDVVSHTKNCEVYCTLARAYIQYDKKIDAIHACESAINVEPKCDEAYFLLGEIMREESKDKAIMYYRKALSIDDTYQAVWAALGSLLCSFDENLNEGIECLTTAIALDQDDGWSYSFLANAYWKKGEHIKAETMFLKAIEIFPEYYDVYKWYMDFLESQGRETEAEEIFQKVKHLIQK